MKLLFIYFYFTRLGQENISKMINNESGIINFEIFLTSLEFIVLHIIDLEAPIHNDNSNTWFSDIKERLLNVIKDFISVEVILFLLLNLPPLPYIYYLHIHIYGSNII